MLLTANLERLLHSVVVDTKEGSLQMQGKLRNGPASSCAEEEVTPEGPDR